MNKSDLKTGMKLVSRSGKVSYVFLNTPNGDIHSGKDNWGDIYNLCEDLKSSTMEEYDIMEVYTPNLSNMGFYKFKDEIGYTLIWKREDLIPVSWEDACISELKIKPVENVSSIGDLNEYQKLTEVLIDFGNCTPDIKRKLIRGLWYIQKVGIK